MDLNDPKNVTSDIFMVGVANLLPHRQAQRLDASRLFKRRFTNHPRSTSTSLSVEAIAFRAKRFALEGIHGKQTDTEEIYSAEPTGL